MSKLTQEQLNSIKNAKTLHEAKKAFQAIHGPAWDAYTNWKPNYSKMSKKELIEIIAELEKRDE